MVNRTYLIGGVLAVVILAVGLGAAFYYGVGPAPGGGSGDTIEEFPTETPNDGGSDMNTTETPPFSFIIDEIEECGQTCRDVTATLDNNQDETATGVTVFTRVFAGEDNTAEADIVWEGKEEVGTMEAASSHTTTRRVELSLQDAQRIEQKGGWITIVTTVESDETTVTFQNSEQVA